MERNNWCFLWTHHHKRLFFWIRLNKEPPNLTFRKKEKGGINFTSTVANTNLDLDTVKAICSEYRIHNADITLRFDATADDLIDVIEGSRIYMPCIYVVNKIDVITLEELEILDKLPHYCPVRYPLFFPSLSCLNFTDLFWTAEIRRENIINIRCVSAKLCIYTFCVDYLYYLGINFLYSSSCQLPAWHECFNMSEKPS